MFPGSNCEHDVVEALGRLGADAELLWHGDATVHGVDAIVLPGGFAHGDYLRPGALARFSPVMGAVAEFARAGGPVVGICNGFQVLTEAGLLPGALCKNRGLKFLCKEVGIRVESTASVLTSSCTPGQLLRLPINHFSGAFTCSPATLAAMEEHQQVVLRYDENPNGSIAGIAGVCSRQGNVVGLMPHPERACDPLGGQDGLELFRALLAAADSSATARA